MDLGENGGEFELEFWPLQHPTEPPDEDKPLKCPISDASLVNGQRRLEERFSDSSALVVKKQAAEEAEEPTVGAVRKRHHTLTMSHQDHNSILRMPLPLPPPIHPYSVEPAP